MYLYGSVCVWVQVPAEAKDVRSYRAGVTGETQDL